ncbi:MAG TPA: hypothetical protein VD794_05975 [Flavisolibacter sp.]|nr:hypothetical protein [Flavisolibacter sp.]
MRTLSFLLILFVMLLSSCSKKEDVKTELDAFTVPKISQLDEKYLVTTEEHLLQPDARGAMRFYYNGNRVVKRDWWPDAVYDTVIYTSPNTITLIQKDILPGVDYNTLKREIKVFNGQVVQKISYDNVSQPSRNDTIDYVYDQQQRLTQTIQKTPYRLTTRQFYYDGNNNLQRVYTTTIDRYDAYVYPSAEELFGGYDNKPNPLKGATLWHDILYRSLSQNNFTTYSHTDHNGTQTRNWTLVYDAKGQVDFSR